jgi:predicted DsbA family dithiol-disulfide isomerase
MGIVDKLKQEFDLRVEWLGFEIHPETPPKGTPLSTMFPRIDAKSMTQRLNNAGAPFGIAFAKIVHISNSRLSLEAAEFAKEHNRFDQFHSALFQAYFSQGKDIGNIEILALVAGDAALDAGSMKAALQAGKYRPMIENARQEAARLGVNAAPTFIIENKDRIVGAQPLEVFRKKLSAY